MKKIMHFLFIIHLVTCCVVGFSQSFPEKENNCFEQFNYDASNRDNVNAYLLSYLSRIVYYQYLNKDNNYSLRPTDTSRFREKFIERTRHFFTASITQTPELQSKTPINNQVGIQSGNVAILKDRLSGPQYEWVWRSDGVGKNPEAMLISTPEAIFVVFRGTDRVDGGSRGLFGTYDWGEWIYTDFNILPQRPCGNCYVRVHKGFYEALHYAGFKNQLVNSIKRFGGENKKIWITGHSLGGGMAQLFAYLLKKVDNISVQGVYVYNSPHPGDVDFANEMNSIIGKNRIQRFEFLDDPISSGPPRFLNWIPGGVEWGRAGTRNWFSKETTGGFKPAIAEKQAAEDMAMLSVLGASVLGGMCFHHPAWIARGLYNLIPASVQAKLPNPPARITDDDEGCNVVDINNGVSGRLYDAGTDIVPSGTYRLKNVSSNRFLSATSTCGLNGCCDLMQVSSGSGDAVKWKIAKVPNALFESYTLTSELNNKVLDADMPNTGNDGCKVHLCGRLSVAVGIRTNQEWRFEKLPNGNYRLKCVAGEKLLRVQPGCSSQDGCRFELHSRVSDAAEWQLIKVN